MTGEPKELDGKIDQAQELDEKQLDQVHGGFGGVHHGGSLNQGGQLDMMAIQSLVSQQQTAVQLATEMLANDANTAAQIAKNLK